MLRLLLMPRLEENCFRLPRTLSIKSKLGLNAKATIADYDHYSSVKGMVSKLQNTAISARIRFRKNSEEYRFYSAKKSIV